MVRSTKLPTSRCIHPNRDHDRVTSASINRRDAVSLLCGIGASLSAIAKSEEFGNGRPIKVLVGVAAGGTQDVLTRAIAEEVRETLGPLIVENRAGAGGRIAARAVKAAPPDGYTLLVGTASMMTMHSYTYSNLEYDPLKDFVPIIRAAEMELALVINQDVPASTLSEFISWAKPQGNKVSFASFGTGTLSHFLGEMLNREAGLDMMHVPFGGPSPARTAVMGGTAPAYFETVGGVLQMLQSGRVKVLATSGKKRSPFLPKVPTLVEAGYQRMVATPWYAYYAPARTPSAIVDRLRQEFSKAVRSPLVRRQMEVAAMYPVENGDHVALTQTMVEEMAFWKQFMQEINYKVGE